MDLDKCTNHHKIDGSGIINLIEELPNQIEMVWDQLSKIVLAANYINVKNIHIIYPPEDYLANELISPLASVLKLPVYFNNLPSNVNGESLIIASSFYGDDENIIRMTHHAAKLGGKLFIVSTGGELASLVNKYRCPAYIYRPGAMDIYSIAFPPITLFYLLHKLRWIEYKDEIEELLLLLRGLIQNIKPEIATEKNIAKQAAVLLSNKIPIIVGSKISLPVINRLSAMLSINSKSLSFGYSINQFRANQIYKYASPEKLINSLFFLIFNSRHNNSADHIELLSACQILEKRRMRYESIAIQPGGTILSELFQGVLLSDFIAYYSSILNDCDPADYVFKEQFDNMVDSNIGHKIRKGGIK